MHQKLVTNCDDEKSVQSLYLNIVYFKIFKILIEHFVTVVPKFRVNWLQYTFKYFLTDPVLPGCSTNTFSLI